MALIKIRFNTKYLEGDQTLKWRILVDDIEYLAENIQVNVPCATSEDVIETGEVKWHLSCEGKITWKNKTAIVNP